MKINAINPAFKGTINTVYQTENGTERPISFNTNNIAYAYSGRSSLFNNEQGTDVFVGNKTFYVPFSYERFQKTYQEANSDLKTSKDLYHE